MTAIARLSGNRAAHLGIDPLGSLDRLLVGTAYRDYTDRFAEAGMQIIEHSIAGTRSAVLRLKRPDTALEFLVFPMVHVASPGVLRRGRGAPAAM